MRQSAAVLCQDNTSLRTLEASLAALEIELVKCSSGEQALEFVMAGRCSTLIADFDLRGAKEAISMAALLPSDQKPALLAVASRAWPGTGQAFQSGANRILYRPLDRDQVKDALRASTQLSRPRRKSPRYEMNALVHLELESGPLTALSIDIGEHGMAVQATEPIPMTSNIAFRSGLPGTDINLQGHADVLWASEHGRAGLFFTKLSPVARKHLKSWLHKRTHKDAIHDLLPPEGDQVSFAATE